MGDGEDVHASFADLRRHLTKIVEERGFFIRCSCGHASYVPLCWAQALDQFRQLHERCEPAPTVGVF